MTFGRNLLAVLTATVLTTGVLCSQFCTLNCAFQGSSLSALASAQDQPAPMEHCHGHHNNHGRKCEFATDKQEGGPRRQCNLGRFQIPAALKSSYGATPVLSSLELAHTTASILALFGRRTDQYEAGTAQPLRSPPRVVSTSLKI